MALSWDDVGGTPVDTPPSVDTSPSPSPDITQHVDALIAHESGGDPSAIGDSGLAVGLGQMHPEVRKAYGVTPNSTPEEQRKAVESYFTDLYKKHNGNVDDALSEYHLGAPNYARDRNSPDNLKYLEAHKQHLASNKAWDAVPGVPVDTSVPQTTEQPSTPEQPTPAPPEEKPLPGVVGGLEPYRALHEAGIPLERNATVEDTGAQLNKQFGLAQDHKLGRYLAAGGKPFLDAASDIITLVSGDKPPSQGALNDAIGNFTRLAAAMHPVVATPEAIGNTVVELAADAGVNPTIGALLGLASSAYAGAKIPTGEAFAGAGGKGWRPTTAPLSAEVPTSVDLGPAMPLKGTAASRQAAQEAASAATEAEAKAAAARTAQEAETTAATKEAEQIANLGQQWTEAQKAVSGEATTAAEQEAAQAQQTAEQARTAVQPSTTARTEAEAALTPAGVTSRQGGQAIGAGLEQRLQEWKEPAQRVYNYYLETHGHEAVDPSNYKGISDQINALDKAGRLTGKAGDTISSLGEQINNGQRVTVKDLDNYKQALDEVLPGGPPKGATQSERALYDFKFGIRDLIRDTATGDEKAWLTEADSVWRDIIIGKGKPRALGNLVKLVQKDPETAVERIFGDGKSEKQGEFAAAIMKELGDHPAAEAVRQGFSKRLIANATDTVTGELDPKKLIKSAADLDETFSSHMLNDGQRTFFKVAQQQQEAADAADAAAKAAAERAKEVGKAGKATIGEAESTAAEGTKAAEKATKERIGAAETKTSEAEIGAKQAGTMARRAQRVAEKPNMLANMTAKGLEVAVGEAAATAFGHPGLGPIFMARFLFPADQLATYLANSKTANLLARALKTPANSAVVPVLMQKIKSATEEKPKKAA